MRARALAQWARMENLSTRTYKPLEYDSRLYLFGTRLYNWIQKTFPLLHRAYFPFLEAACLHRRAGFILGSRRFKAVVRDCAPDVVVSMHAHLNHGYRDLVMEAMPEKPPVFAIYCGELGDGPGFSRHWVNPEADLFAGPFAETCEAAISRGMPEDKVYEAGLLLRPAFFEKPKAKADANLLRKKWDLDPKLPLLVLGTGANGVNRHLPVAIATRALGEAAQIVALCGENQKTMRWLETMGEHPKVPLCPLPTIPADEIAPLLRSATMLFARPGAGTTSEAIACGTPVLFDVSHGVMPQEQNNLSFWQKRTGRLLATKKAADVPRLLRSSSLPATLPYSGDETPLRFLEKLREIVASR